MKVILNVSQLYYMVIIKRKMCPVTMPMLLWVVVLISLLQFFLESVDINFLFVLCYVTHIVFTPAFCLFYAFWVLCFFYVCLLFSFYSHANYIYIFNCLTLLLFRHCSHLHNLPSLDVNRPFCQGKDWFNYVVFFIGKY